ncbi:MAG TPA: sodium-dependent bicarbonate transport family permease [Microvirga sp.]|jgi:hypothetical protein
MTFADLVAASLLSPPVLCFVLGAVAVLLRSDLRLPEPVFQALSVYLLLAIGLKGGVDLSQARLSSVALPALAALGLGVAIPVWIYQVLRRLAGFAVADAAAIAAHYGSVSAVTFIAVLGYLDATGTAYEGFMTALLAIMEVPAIVVALILARWSGAGGQGLGAALGEVISGKSILLLTGGMAIGYLAGPEGMAPVKPFFVDLFRGALCLFLLELGVVAAQRARDVRAAGPMLIAVALGAPVLHAMAGLLIAFLVGLSMGGAIVLATLAASASYIAAPAAVRIGLPEANPGYYLGASLGVTFPFNVIVGIPLYAAAARLLYA